MLVIPRYGWSGGGGGTDDKRKPITVQRISERSFRRKWKVSRVRPTCMRYWPHYTESRSAHRSFSNTRLLPGRHERRMRRDRCACSSRRRAASQTNARYTQWPRRGRDSAPSDEDTRARVRAYNLRRNVAQMSRRVSLIIGGVGRGGGERTARLASSRKWNGTRRADASAFRRRDRRTTDSRSRDYGLLDAR